MHRGLQKRTPIDVRFRGDRPLSSTKARVETALGAASEAPTSGSLLSRWSEIRVLPGALSESLMRRALRAVSIHSGEGQGSGARNPGDS
jgi:hypothetical protein